jgi:ClpP class serine protease
LPEVRSIALDVSSGGGIVIDALWEAADAIYNSAKPVTAYATDLCCSAAYLLASQASGGIIARTDVTKIGSIGVMAAYSTDKDDIVIFRSANAENKNADPAEQPAQYQTMIDAIEDKMISYISRSLGLTNEKIVADFGKGATITADKALEQGMIQKIYTDSMFGKKQDAETATDNVINTLEQASLEAIKAEAMQAGIEAERARVAELQAYATDYNAKETCAAAIASGKHASEVLRDILDEQKRNLTAKAIQQDVEAVAVQDQAEEALQAELSASEEAFKKING